MQLGINGNFVKTAPNKLKMRRTFTNRQYFYSRLGRVSELLDDLRGIKFGVQVRDGILEAALKAPENSHRQ